MIIISIQFRATHCSFQDLTTSDVNSSAAGEIIIGVASRRRLADGGCRLFLMLFNASCGMIMIGCERRVRSIDMDSD